MMHWGKTDKLKKGKMTKEEAETFLFTQIPRLMPMLLNDSDRMVTKPIWGLLKVYLLSRYVDECRTERWTTSELQKLFNAEDVEKMLRFKIEISIGSDAEREEMRRILKEDVPKLIEERAQVIGKQKFEQYLRDNGIDPNTQP